VSSGGLEGGGENRSIITIEIGFRRRSSFLHNRQIRYILGTSFTPKRCAKKKEEGGLIFLSALGEGLRIWM